METISAKGVMAKAYSNILYHTVQALENPEELQRHEVFT